MPRFRSASVRSLVLAAVAPLVAACGAPEPGAFVHDPWQGLNRDVHSFNKGLDTVLVRPAAVVYEAATPTLVRHLATNGLNMLALPAVFVNQVLQADLEGALSTMGRFGVNVLVGGVLLDPATEFGLPRARTDLGVTLAKWGVGEGPYVELPFLGPANARDGAARVAQIALDPFNFITGVPALDALGPGTAVLGVIDLRARNFEVIDRVLYESEDSYVTAQTGWVQMRRRQIAGGATAESLPDVFDEDE